MLVLLKTLVLETGGQTQIVSNDFARAHLNICTSTPAALPVDSRAFDLSYSSRSKWKSTLSTVDIVISSI